jgi:hypothetical protein
MAGHKSHQKAPNPCTPLDPKLTPSVIPRATPAAGAGGGPAPAAPPGMTVPLQIDLCIRDGNGHATAPPMTVVYAPDPKQLGAKVDVLIWFHGHKGGLKNVNLSGISAEGYLNVPALDLRQFILSTKKREFVLVVPTLGEKSEPGLLTQQQQADAFLAQVLNGVRANINPNVTAIDNIVLAAHSGGGAIMGRWAKFGGTLRSNVKEIWCVDCTYGSAGSFLSWAKQPGHANDRLWVFSTGSRWVPRCQDPDPKKKCPGPDNPVVDPHDHRTGTGDDAERILNHAKATSSKSIEILIEPMPPKSHAHNFNYGDPGDHYAAIKFYFSQLVNSSRILS